MMSNWREGTKPWDKENFGVIYPTLKVPLSNSKAVVMFLNAEPRKVNTSIGESYSIDVALLDGKETYIDKYDKNTESKEEIPTNEPGIYSIWLSAKSLVQALVNAFPDEDSTLLHEVVKIGRQRVTGGKYGAYLGYTVEPVAEYNEALAKRLIKKYEADAENAQQESEESEEQVVSDDLDVAYKLLSNSLESLGSMTFDQINNFLENRKKSGLMETIITATEAANYCVSKNPDKFKIEQDGDIKKLLLQ